MKSSETMLAYPAQREFGFGSGVIERMLGSGMRVQGEIEEAHGLLLSEALPQ
jgi:hypothetical protein